MRRELAKWRDVDTQFRFFSELEAILYAQIFMQESVLQDSLSAYCKWRYEAAGNAEKSGSFKASVISVKDDFIFMCIFDDFVDSMFNQIFLCSCMMMLL